MVSHFCKRFLIQAKIQYPFIENIWLRGRDEPPAKLNIPGKKVFLILQKSLPLLRRC